MSSKRTAQSAKIPDLSRLSISSRTSSMPVTTRSMTRGDLAQARRQRVPLRSQAFSRPANDDGDDDDDDDDDSDEDNSAMQERVLEARAVQDVSLHFAATVPVAWFDAQAKDNTPQRYASRHTYSTVVNNHSDQLLRTIGVLGRHAANNPDVLVALRSVRTVSVGDRPWVDNALQMLFGKLKHIQTNFPPNDVLDTAKALAGWLNAARSIARPLKTYHSRRDIKQQFATILLVAWEFLISSDFDFNTSHAYQPPYTRADPYGNSLFRRVTEGGAHGVFGLGDLNWALTDLDSRELAQRTAVVCRYVYEHTHQPSAELTAALQDIAQSKWYSTRAGWYRY